MYKSRTFVPNEFPRNNTLPRSNYFLIYLFISEKINKLTKNKNNNNNNKI